SDYRVSKAQRKQGPVDRTCTPTRGSPYFSHSMRPQRAQRSRLGPGDDQRGFAQSLRPGGPRQPVARRASRSLTAAQDAPGLVGPAQRGTDGGEDAGEQKQRSGRALRPARRDAVAHGDPGDRSRGRLKGEKDQQDGGVHSSVSRNAAD